jgi:membrane protease YdiL (CAAX protease family)
MAFFSLVKSWWRLSNSQNTPDPREDVLDNKRLSMWGDPTAKVVFVLVVYWILSKVDMAFYFFLRRHENFHSAATGFTVILAEFVLLTALPMFTALWLAQMLFEQRQSSAFKRPDRNWYLQFAFGFGIGTFTFLCFVCFAWLTGNYHIIGVRAHYPIIYFVWLVPTIAVGVLSEEAIFRGYVLPTLERRWGTGIALVVSASVFAVGHGHLGQANIAESVFHPILHAFALGTLLGAAYLVNRTLWLSLGLHFAWDFVGAVFFNSHTYATQSVFRYAYWPPAFDLTGIAFGASVVICSLGAFLLFLYGRRRGPMKNERTSHHN